MSSPSRPASQAFTTSVTEGPLIRPFTTLYCSPYASGGANSARCPSAQVTVQPSPARDPFSFRCLPRALAMSLPTDGFSATISLIQRSIRTGGTIARLDCLEETGDRTSTRLRALLPGGRSRGARKRPRPLDSADHSRSPRRSDRGRESARRGHPHVFHPPLAAEREQGTLGCFQSSCNSPESIFASLARGSLSYSAVTPTLG